MGTRLRLPALRGANRQAFALALGLVASISAFRCGSDRSAEPGRANAALEGGQPWGTADVMAVGRFATATGACTGSYIGNRTVLTAAHCAFGVAQGCVNGWAGSPIGTFMFANTSGSPFTGAQTINVLGMVVHPDAVGTRVSSCTNTVPSPPCASTAADAGATTYYDLPSCGLVLQCANPNQGLEITGGWGWKGEHDMALLYLASDPVDIDPMRVIVGPGVSAPWKNLYSYADIETFTDEDPTVTLVGYGLGSFDWGDGAPAQLGRDLGTAVLTDNEATFPRPIDCAGNPGGTSVESAVVVQKLESQHAEVMFGDSGSPVLIGSGSVGAADDPPTELPGGSGLSGRYAAGVASTKYGAAGAVFAATYTQSNGAWLVATVGDLDGDAIPDSADNCVSVPNSDQANCNSDAEIDEGAVVLGDACDPVPCPLFKSPVTLQADISSDIESCYGTVTTRDIRREIHPNTIGSHHPTLGTELSDSGNETRFRFCQKDASNGVDCAVGSNQRPDAHFTATPTSGISDWWLPTTLASSSSGIKTYDYPSTPSAETWDYWADRATWISNGWIANPGTAAKPGATAETSWTTTSGLDGFFGLRGDWSTMLGTSSTQSNGIHSSPNNGQKLSRHYEPHAADAIVEKVYQSCLVSCGFPCDQIDPTVPIYWCPLCSHRPPGHQYDEDPLAGGILAKASNGSWGLVSPENQILMSGDFFDAIGGYLNDGDLVHVRGSEPFEGASWRKAQSLFLAVDGTTVEAAVIAQDGTLSVDRSVESSSTSMDGRSGFVTAYSQRLDTAFVIGGLVDDEPTDEIWALPLAGVPYLLDIGDYRPAEPRAAVVSASDSALWILDSPAGDDDRRLVRIDLTARTFQEVWSGEASTPYPKSWLLSERNGDILIISRGSYNYCTLRYGAEPFKLGTEQARLMRSDSGLLTGPPLVDGAGYLFVTRSGSAVASTRVTTLVDQYGGYPDVAACL
jgi:hypothetical protein